MSPIVIHPAASARFDQRGRALLAGVEIRQPSGTETGPTSRAFVRPDLPIAAHLGEDDIVGSLTWKEDDQDGVEIRRSTTRGGQSVELNGAQHWEFRELARSIHRTKAVRDLASLEAIEALVFDWLVESAAGPQTGSVTEVILPLLDARVVRQTVIVPVFELFIQSELSLGRGVLRTLSASALDSWRDQVIRFAPEVRDQVHQQFERFRMETQGRAAFWTEVDAEPSYAIEVAFKRAEEALALLRIFSRGMFQPTQRSYVLPKGMELLQSRRYYVTAEGQYRGSGEGIVSPVPFDMSVEDGQVRQDVALGLGPMNALLLAEERSSFQDEVLQGLFLYSRVGLYDRPSEKLIHLLVALEAILLRNDTESIVSGVSERMAFVVGTSPEQRQSIAQNAKEAYGLRSRFVHHGSEIQEDASTLATVRQFMQNAFKFFINVVRATDSYPTRVDFINALDARKWM